MRYLMPLTLQYQSRTARGFTVLELLLTVVILAVLAILTVTATSSVVERGRAVKCMAHLRTLGSAFQRYAMDYQGRLPVRTDPVNTSVAQQWHREIWPILRQSSDAADWGVARNRAAESGYQSWPFLCPSDRNPASTTPGLSYAVNTRLTNARTSQIGARQVLLIELKNRYMATGSELEKADMASNHGGKTHILFADYHIEALRTAETPSRHEAPEIWEITP